MSNQSCFDPNSNVQNRIFRVFVSSTFIDMQDERQYLMETVFPRIKRICQDRDVYFIPIDLRWGITKEQSESGQVVEVCLKSIKQSKPYFIGLLGERYGWKPEKEELKKNPNMKRDFDFLEEDFEKKLSLTEIEMQYGVLREPELMNAAFWIRSKDSIPEAPSYNSPLDDKKLEALKAEVRSQSRYSVGEYASIEDLGEQVESFLIGVVDELFPEKASQLEKLMVQQHSFMQQKRMLYVPRRENYERINAFIDSASQFFTISGDRGNGKSALISNWMETRPDLEFAYCFVGASEMSDNPTEILKLLIAQLNPDLIKEYGEKKQDKLGSDSDEKPKTQGERPMDELDKLQKKFQAAVNDWQISKPNGKLVVIIDGINQISEYFGSKELIWISDFPQSVKTVFSTWEDDATMKRLKELGSETMELEALTVEQRKKIIKYFLEERNRELSPEQINRIAEGKESASPIVLRTLLDELCYFGIFEKLDQQIEIYLSANSQEEFFDRVLGRLEKSFGYNVVSRLLTGLSASRLGLSNEELLGVANSLKEDSEENSSETASSASGGDAVNPPCTLYNWEQIAFSIDNHFMVRAGQNCFSHDIIASTAKKRYQSGITQARRRLIQYLEDNGSLDRKCEEIPWLLWQLEDWSGLNRFLLDFEILNFMFESFDFRRCWLELNKRGRPLDAYFDLDASKLPLAKQALSFFNLADFAESIGDLHISERGFKKSLDIIRSNPDMYNADNTLYESNYATALNRLGNIYSSLNRFSQAEEMYSQAIDIYKRLNQDNPEKYGSDVAMLLNNLGLLHLQDERLDLSEKELSEALSIYRSIDDQSNAMKYNIARILLNLGLLHFKKKRYSESKDAYVESLDIYREFNSMVPGICDSEIANTQLDMGFLFVSSGNFHEAEPSLTEALTIYRRAAEDNPDAHTKELATTLLNLGLLYLQTKRFSEAKAAFVEANTLFNELNARFPGVYDDYIAKTQMDLGFLDINARRYPEAENYLAEALVTFRRLTAENPGMYKNELAMTLLDQGILYRKTKRYSEAKAAFAEANTLFNDLNARFPGVYDAEIGKTQINLGSIYTKERQIPEADNCLTNALEIFRRLTEDNPGVYKPELTLALLNQGKFYMSINRFSEAEAVFIEVQTLFEELNAAYPGLHDVDIGKTQGDLGEIYFNLKRFPEAESLLSESLKLFHRLSDQEPGVYDRDLIVYLLKRGDFYKRIERYSEASEDYLEALSVLQRLNANNPGDFDDIIAFAKKELALVYFNMERYPETASVLDEAIGLYRRLADKNPDVYNQNYIKTLVMRADFYSQFERYSEAEKDLLEALSLEQDKEGIAHLFDMLGNIYFDTEHYSKAEDCYNESLKACRQLTVDNPDVYIPAVADVLSDLARTHLLQNRDSEAEKELNEAVNIYRSLNESERSLESVGGGLHSLAYIYKERLHDYSRCKELLLESQAAFEKLNKLHPGEYEIFLNDVKNELIQLEAEENSSSNHE